MPASRAVPTRRQHRGRWTRHRKTIDKKVNEPIRGARRSAPRSLLAHSGPRPDAAVESREGAALRPTGLLPHPGAHALSLRSGAFRPPVAAATSGSRRPAAPWGRCAPRYLRAPRGPRVGLGRSCKPHRQKPTRPKPPSRKTINCKSYKRHGAQKQSAPQGRAPRGPAASTRETCPRPAHCPSAVKGASRGCATPCGRP